MTCRISAPLFGEEFLVKLLHAASQYTRIELGFYVFFAARAKLLRELLLGQERINRLVEGTGILKVEEKTVLAVLDDRARARRAAGNGRHARCPRFENYKPERF